MKFARKILGMVMLVCGMLFLNTIVYADAEIPASEFEDEDFYSFIMEKFDSNGDGVLMESEAQAVTYFDLIGDNQISSIKGIEYFVNIKELVLNGKITDISPVGALTNLEKFDMDWCDEVEDYSVLNQLKNMKYLDLAQTNVSDLSFIEYMPNLKQIFLSNCTEITDFSPIESADNLEFFIADNTSFSDLSILHGKNILRLNVMGCKGIDDYSLISQFDLYLLAINGDTLTDLSILDGCTHLQFLYIDGAVNVTDWSVLSTYSMFMTIELTNCNLSDISFVQELGRLSEVNFNGNNITDISPLMTSAGSIKYLELNDNELTDISIVAQFSKLYELQVQNNKLTTIPDMTGLEELLLVYLGGNEITEEEASSKISCTYSLISGSTIIPSIGVITGDNNIENSDNTTDNEAVTEAQKIIESVLDDTIQAEGEFDEDTYLEGERITDISGYQNIIDELHKKIQDINEVRIYDIALYKDVTENENTVKVKVQPNKSIKVSLRVRDIISGAGYSVYRQEENGSLTKLTTYREGQIITFYSEHFSIFTLVITKFIGGNGNANVEDTVAIFDDEQVPRENETTSECDVMEDCEENNTEGQKDKQHTTKENDNNEIDKKVKDDNEGKEDHNRGRNSDNTKAKVIIVSVITGIVLLDIIAYEIYAYEGKKRVVGEVKEKVAK